MCCHFSRNLNHERKIFLIENLILGSATMLLQVKVYLIAILYIFGILFQIVFPPRNYEQSGAKLRIMRRSVDETKFMSYIDFHTLLKQAEKLVKENNDVLKEVFLKPNTYENRSVVAFEVRSDWQIKKPGILIVGSLNGMAWGVPNALLELIKKLLYDSNYQSPFFNDYDWYIIPMTNPDAVEFTRSLRNYKSINESEWSHNITARIKTRPNMWLKNVDKENINDQCFGTNINRNFPYHWRDDVHKPLDKCSQFYPGAKPFSSSEAEAIYKYVNSLGGNINLAIHLHASFVYKKDFILYPWRYSNRQPSNYEKLQAIGEYAARLARLPDGRLYEVHQSSNDQKVAGALSDFISGVIGTDLVFLVKPFHEQYPNDADMFILESYIERSLSAVLGIVRGWRSSSKQNTLSFFGKDIEF